MFASPHVHHHMVDTGQQFLQCDTCIQTYIVNILPATNIQLNILQQGTQQGTNIMYKICTVTSLHEQSVYIYTHVE